MKQFILYLFIILGLFGQKKSFIKAAAGGEGPGEGLSPPNISSLKPTVVWNDQGANSADNQKVTVTINKIALTGFDDIVRIHSITFIPNSGSGLSSWYTNTITNGATISHQFTGVNDNQSVQFRVKVVYSNTNPSSAYSAWSNSTSIGNRTPPGSNAPTVTWVDQGVNSDNNQKVNVSYTFASGVTKVDVLRYSGSGTSNSIGRTSPSTFTDTGVHDNQSVSYRLRSYDVHGNYAYSGITNGVIGDRTAPASNAPTVTWMDQGINSNNSQKLSIVYSMAAGVTKVDIDAISGSGTSDSNGRTSDDPYVDTGVHDNQTVSYRIKSYDAAGNYSYSSPVSRGIGDRTAPSSNAPTVTWLDQGLNSGDAQKVNVGYSFASGVTKVDVDATGGSGTNDYNGRTSPNTFTDTGVHDSQTVTYRIRSYDAAGNYSYSSPVSRGIGDRTAPSSNAPTVTWLDQGLNSGDAQKVNVSYSFASTVTKVDVDATGGSGTNDYNGRTSPGTFTDTGIYDSQTVTYRIRSYDAAGNYSYSSPVSRGIGDRTAPSSNAPTVTWLDQGLNSGDAQKVNVSYSFASAVTKVDVDATGGSGTNDYNGRTSPGTFTDTGIYDSQTVTYRIRSYDAAGNYSYSSPVSRGIGDRTAPNAANNINLVINNYTLSFSASSSNASTAEIQWYKNGSVDGTKITVPVSSISSSKEIMEETDSYYVRLRLLDAAGNYRDANSVTKAKYTSLVTDQLSYSYNTKKQLSRVTDAISSSAVDYDYDTHSATTHYSYDNNGNMTGDLNRGISSISYNHFNLPKRIVKGSTTIDYKYNSEGQRTEKWINNVRVSKYIRNSDGAIYAELDQNNKIKYTNIISGTGAAIGRENYINGIKQGRAYYLKDHLGNNRVLVKDKAVKSVLSDAFNSGNTWGPWTAYGNTADEPYKLVQDADDKSNKVMRLKITKGTTHLAKNLTIKPNTRYLLSYRIKFNKAAESYNGMYYYYKDAGNNNGAYYYVPGNTNQSGWQLIKRVFTSPATGGDIGAGKTFGGTTVSLAMRIHSDAVTNSEILVDDISVVELNPGETERLSVASAQDYYPFGGTMPGRNLQQVTDEENKFKHQGKERDKETGYDYFEARLFDSDIGRFLQVDAYAEKYQSMNPYIGMGNNPMFYTDPTGDSLVQHNYILNGLKVTIVADHLIMDKIIAALDIIANKMSEKSKKKFTFDGFRSMEEQENLYGRYIETIATRLFVSLNSPGAGEDGVRQLMGSRYRLDEVGKPGYSYHNSGFGFDVKYNGLDSDKDRKIVKGAFTKQGFVQGTSFDEPWHFDARPISRSTRLKKAIEAKNQGNIPYFYRSIPKIKLKKTNAVIGK